MGSFENALQSIIDRVLKPKMQELEELSKPKGYHEAISLAGADKQKRMDVMQNRAAYQAMDLLVPLLEKFIQAMESASRYEHEGKILYRHPPMRKAREILCDSLGFTLPKGRQEQPDYKRFDRQEKNQVHLFAEIVRTGNTAKKCRQNIAKRYRQISQTPDPLKMADDWGLGILRELGFEPEEARAILQSVTPLEKKPSKKRPGDPPVVKTCGDEIIKKDCQGIKTATIRKTLKEVAKKSPSFEKFTSNVIENFTEDIPVVMLVCPSAFAHPLRYLPFMLITDLFKNFTDYIQNPTDEVKDKLKNAIKGHPLEYVKILCLWEFWRINKSAF